MFLFFSVPPALHGWRVAIWTCPLNHVGSCWWLWLPKSHWRVILLGRARPRLLDQPTFRHSQSLRQRRAAMKRQIQRISWTPCLGRLRACLARLCWLLACSALQIWWILLSMPWWSTRDSFHSMVFQFACYGNLVLSGVYLAMQLVPCEGQLPS